MTQPSIFVGTDPGLFRLVLPVPPSANVYWRKYRGVIVKSDAARAYATEIGWIVKRRIVRPFPLDTDIVIRFFFYRMPKGRMDLDNVNKVLIDSLKKIAFEDDRQVVELRSRRIKGATEGRIELYLAVDGTPSANRLLNGRIGS